MSGPQLWILAGGNGAGKSTFFRLYLKPLGIHFVNADEMARTMFAEASMQASYEAARVATSIRERLLQDRVSFCFETVFSHPSKIDLIAQAKMLGYEIVLTIIHLNNTALNVARVAQRVSEGGHNVPAEKIKTRIPRTLAYLKEAIPLCDRVQIYDNSRTDQPFQPILSIKQGLPAPCQSPLPAWVTELIGDF